VKRPPFRITTTVVSRLEEISRLVGRFEGLSAPPPQPQLRRENRIRTVQGSVAIEGNTLSLDQVTAVLEGKRVVGPPREIREVRNALAAYDLAPRLRPDSERDLLRAHGILMEGLSPEAGRWRSGAVGVLKGSKIAHLAPPAKQVPRLMTDLLEFVGRDHEVPVVIRACVAHYEIEFIHPFADGNGRMGRFWQHVALLRWSPVFAHVPAESVVRERQQSYYDVLARSGQAGDCTPFLEFSLEALRDALSEFLVDFRPESETAERRLALARERFAKGWFTRRDYLALHQRLSTSTASRDLRLGVEQGMLQRRGEKALTEYRFVTTRRRGAH
jgi:Fic family protein